MLPNALLSALSSVLPPSPSPQASLFQWLRESYGVEMDVLRQELLAGVTKANYNQHTLEVNALAGEGAGLGSGCGLGLGWADERAG